MILVYLVLFSVQIPGVDRLGLLLVSYLFFLPTLRAYLAVNTLSVQWSCLS